MSAKQQIINNLVVSADFSATSKITFTFYDVQHECEIKFPAHSWDLARKAGYTFNQVLDNTLEKTFDFLLWILQFDFDPESHNFYIKKIVLSSLWRPKTSGTSPHEHGRGLDIIKIDPSIGNSIICNINSTDEEDVYLIKLRDAAFAAKFITQYFSPWKMYFYDSSGVLHDGINTRTSELEKIHLDHVHFTITK